MARLLIFLGDIEAGIAGLVAFVLVVRWSRGMVVKLIAPQFVKSYVKSNKNDRNDSEAICEAMSRPTMRFVEVKSVEQQDIQAVHRIRSELVGQRTAKANQIRGLVAEYGLVAPIHLIDSLMALESNFYASIMEPRLLP
jgi:transposase